MSQDKRETKQELSRELFGMLLEEKSKASGLLWLQWEIGEKASALRKQTGHGDWAGVCANLGRTPRNMNDYINLFEAFPDVEKLVKAHTSMYAAFVFLRKEKREDKGENDDEGNRSDPTDLGKLSREDLIKALRAKSKKVEKLESEKVEMDKNWKNEVDGKDKTIGKLHEQYRDKFNEQAENWGKRVDEARAKAGDPGLGKTLSKAMKAIEERERAVEERERALDAWEKRLEARDRTVNLGLVDGAVDLKIAS